MVLRGGRGPREGLEGDLLRARGNRVGGAERAGEKERRGDEDGGLHDVLHVHFDLRARARGRGAPGAGLRGGRAAAARRRPCA